MKIPPIFTSEGFSLLFAEYNRLSISGEEVENIFFLNYNEIDRQLIGRLERLDN